MTRLFGGIIVFLLVIVPIFGAFIDGTNESSTQSLPSLAPTPIMQISQESIVQCVSGVTYVCNPIKAYYSDSVTNSTCME